MKTLCLALLSALLVGCASAPRSVPVVPAYREVRVGMSCDKVDQLLGKAHAFIAQGRQGCWTAVWVGPTDSRGYASRLMVSFWDDRKAHYVETDTVKNK